MYVKLDLPAGIARVATEYAASGRYYDADLVRWWQGVIQPMGGWRNISTTTVSGVARSIVTWIDNSNQIWAGIGTDTGLHVMTQTGVVSDVTPAGFTAGREDASFGGGYGSGAYGAASYGPARSNISVVNRASMWTLDVFGQFLIGCMPEDGSIYRWELATGTPAAVIANAPTNCTAVLSSESLFVLALGAGGDPRRIDWSDRGDENTWTPSVINLAGTVQLQSNGKIICGKRFRGGDLIFTTTDVHLARYVGRPEVFIFERLANGCGIVSAQAAAVVGNRAFWMTDSGFWEYNGFAQPLPCDVQDFVFENLSESQRSKVHAVHNSGYGEVWWFYPSKDSEEPDRYVIYNYLEGYWNIGELARTCGTNQDAFAKPLYVDIDGQVYEHEIGKMRDAREPYVRSAPIEMGNGEQFIYAREYVPDEQTVGESEILFHTRMYPNGPESTYGPVQSASPAHVRFSGRQVAYEYRFNDGEDARVGSGRVKIAMGGSR